MKFAHHTRPEVAGELAEKIVRDLLGLTERDIGHADTQIEVKSVEGSRGAITLTAEQLFRKRQGWFVLVKYDRPRHRPRVTGPDGETVRKSVCTIKVADALRSRELDIAIVDGATLLNAIAAGEIKLESRQHTDGRALARWYYRLQWSALQLVEHRAIDDGDRPVTLWRHPDTDPDAIDTLAEQARVSRRNLFAPFDSEGVAI